MVQALYRQEERRATLSAKASGTDPTPFKAGPAFPTEILMSTKGEGASVSGSADSVLVTYSSHVPICKVNDWCGLGCGRGQDDKWKA